MTTLPRPQTLVRPPRTYPLGIGELTTLANILCNLDGRLSCQYAKDLIGRGHHIIEHALGPDAVILYDQTGDEANNRGVGPAAASCGRSHTTDGLCPGD